MRQFPMKPRYEILAARACYIVHSFLINWVEQAYSHTPLFRNSGISVLTFIWYLHLFKGFYHPLVPQVAPIHSQGLRLDLPQFLRISKLTDLRWPLGCNMAVRKQVLILSYKGQGHNCSFHQKLPHPPFLTTSLHLTSFEVWDTLQKSTSKKAQKRISNCH